MLSKKICVAFALTSLVAGCGTPALTSGSPVLPGTLTASKGRGPAQPALQFEPVAIRDLMTALNKPENKGRLVTFEGSFGKESWSYTYGVTTYGYKLWDHHGNGIRSRNICSETLPDWSGRINDSRDLNRDAARELLARGNFVRIEGAYHPGEKVGFYKVGTITTEPSIDIYFINGRPVREYVSK